MDTIFALATAHGKAGVAVIRISGDLAWSTGEMLCAGSLPAPRVAGLRVLRDAAGIRLDEALILTFPQNESFTGEQVIELQTHGSTAVITALLRYLSSIPGLRHSEPGEFTRRALENGRLDLAQVEGLADLIDAETEAQRRQALRVLSGDLGKRAETWRKDLIRAAALIEATIDFVDEDVPVDVTPEVSSLLSGVSASLHTEIAGVLTAERIRTGFEVAIIGAPNVGKSTLLNALAGREAAIISEYAGTTRDVIEVRMDLDGLPVTLLDTAGIRETDDHVENIGISRALARADTADLRVFLIEDSAPTEVKLRPDDIVLRAKSDLLEDQTGAISGVTGHGVNDLISAISGSLNTRVASVGIATRERHRASMQRAEIGLLAATSLLESGIEFSDLAAEEMRTAIRALDALVGRIDVETVLDEIFASFCLGK